MQFFYISGDHFCSDIHDSYDASAQLSVFDKFGEQLPPETTQSVVNSSDELVEEISASAAVQSKQTRYPLFSFQYLHCETLTKHCFLYFFLLYAVHSRKNYFVVTMKKANQQPDKRKLSI